MDTAPETVPPDYFTNDREMLEAELAQGAKLDICYRGGREARGVPYQGARIVPTSLSHPQGVTHVIAIKGVDEEIDWSIVLGVRAAR